MDQLEAIGSSIQASVGPTTQIFGTLLQPNADKIKSTPRATFTYGSDPRQQLDVYYPSKNPTGEGCPILIFMYGGGLVRGDRIMPMVPNELLYANLGHFFAENAGFVVVIPDYRLVPQAKFPSGGEDLALAIEWLQSNMKDASGPRDLFIMGNSAGGIHLSTYLLNPVFAESRKQILPQNKEQSLILKGAIFLAVPYHFRNADPGRAGTLTHYYGDRVDQDSPMGLLSATLKEGGSVSSVLPGVRFLSLTGTLDPEDEVLSPNRDFVDLWQSSEQSSEPTLQVETMNGHNHISPTFALACGDPQAEAWGYLVGDFCSSARSR